MNKKILLGISAILLTGFLFHYWLAGQAVYGDGIYYWLLTRSVGIDHDLKLNDELAHHYSWIGNNTIEKPNIIGNETKQSLQAEYHLPIGPSLFWLPWFFAGDLLAKLFSSFNHKILTNGYSDIYQITVGLGAVVYATIGIIAIFKLLSRFYSAKISWTAIIVVLLASNLFYYTSLDILNSHAISFMLSSIQLLLLYNFFKKPKYFSAFIIGLIFGLQIITRTQDALFIIGIFLIFIFSWKNLKLNINKTLKLSLVQTLLFIIGALITLSPQLAVWFMIYGGLFNIPYAQNNNNFNFFHPQILGVLVNSQTGILIFSPVLVICIIGMIYFSKPKKY